MPAAHHRPESPHLISKGCLSLPLIFFPPAIPLPEIVL